MTFEMTSKLEYLFNIVRDKSTELRGKYRDEFDGKGFWQPIKKILAKVNINALDWKKISQDIVESIMTLPEYYKNGYGDEHIIETNHFLIQQVRIPTTELPSLKKIVQLALNIGQFYGMNDVALMERINYDSLNLNKLSRYVTKKDIQHISSKISDSLISSIETYLLSMN